MTAHQSPFAQIESAEQALVVATGVVLLGHADQRLGLLEHVAHGIRDQELRALVRCDAGFGFVCLHQDRCARGIAVVALGKGAPCVAGFDAVVVDRRQN
jgi:hypothetical protein